MSFLNKFYFWLNVCSRIFYQSINQLHALNVKPKAKPQKKKPRIARTFIKLKAKLVVTIFHQNLSQIHSFFNNKSSKKRHFSNKLDSKQNERPLRATKFTNSPPPFPGQHLLMVRTAKEMSAEQPKLLDRFEIILDNTEEVYFAGQEITGKVIIECSEPRQLNEVLFEVKGRARTHWVQSRKTCSANEAYFCEQFNTSYTSKLPKNDKQGEGGGKEGGGRRLSSKGDTKHLGRTLPPGLHQIPFSYTLPKHLPSSFEGDFGFVRYTCRAICERPWDFDIVCFRAFSVIGIEDLNNQDAELLSLPMETRSTHPVTWLCMKLGAVQAEIRLAKGGYTPGEEMHLNLRIQNGSRRSLRGLNIRLYQNVTYRSKTFAGAELQRTTRHIVQKVVVADKVRRGAEFSCQDRTVSVPSVPPKMITKCKLIDISYCLELHCNSPVFSISLPVNIGTIPLLPPILAKMNANGSVVKAITGGNGPTTTTKEKEKDPEVRVKVTDETGKTVDGEKEKTGGKKKTSSKGEEDRMDPETERMQKDAAKKRVRMPSSVLSELYPALPSPYYRECSSSITFGTDRDREKKFHFGQTQFAPKYPFYE